MHTKSHEECRQCSRCGLPLTDQPSLERGIGPICDKLSTALFCKTIPVNRTLLYMGLVSFNSLDLPDEDVPFGKVTLNPRKMFESVKQQMLNKFKEMDNTTSNGFLANGVNFNNQVKVIDWICSFKMNGSARLKLSQIVKHMGFHVLAGVLSGMSSTSEAKILFDDKTGFLTLEGAKCKGGKEECYKLSLANPGKVKFPTRLTKHFQVHASLADKFYAIVEEYWPVLDTVSSTAELAKAKQWWETELQKQVLAVVPTVSVAANPNSKPVLGTDEGLIVHLPGDNIEVSFTWPTGTRKSIGWKIVDRIKEIVPMGRRKWNSKKVAWEIRLLPERKNELLDLKQIFAEHKFTLKEVTPSV